MLFNCRMANNEKKALAKRTNLCYNIGSADTLQKGDGCHIKPYIRPVGAFAYALYGFRSDYYGLRRSRLHLFPAYNEQNHRTGKQPGGHSACKIHRSGIGGGRLYNISYMRKDEINEKPGKNL